MYKISSSFRFASPIVPTSVTSVLEMSSAFKYVTCLQISRSPASVRAVSASTRRSRSFKRLINSIPLHASQEVASAPIATSNLHTIRRTSSKFDRFEDPAPAASACAAAPQRLLRQTQFEQEAALESRSKSLEETGSLRNAAHQSTSGSQVRPSLPVRRRRYRCSREQSASPENGSLRCGAGHHCCTKYTYKLIRQTQDGLGGKRND